VKGKVRHDGLAASKAEPGVSQQRIKETGSGGKLRPLQKGPNWKNRLILLMWLVATTCVWGRVNGDGTLEPETDRVRGTNRGDGCLQIRSRSKKIELGGGCLIDWGGEQTGKNLEKKPNLVGETLIDPERRKQCRVELLESLEGEGTCGPRIIASGPDQKKGGDTKG